ncbi:MAG: hypothetical protein ACRCWC_09230 [Plesiomonas shigelloides]
MTEQTKAQRLANGLENSCLFIGQEAAAELRRLDRHEQATRVWSEKTDWVQETAKPKELGMHRADVLKKRIDDLTMLNAELVAAFDKLMLDMDEGVIEITTMRNANAALAKAKEQT